MFYEIKKRMIEIEEECVVQFSKRDAINRMPESRKRKNVTREGLKKDPSGLYRGPG